MSPDLTARLRKLEVRAKMDDSMGNLTDKQLFARTRAVAERPVDLYGGPERAILAVEEESGTGSGALLRKALGSSTASKFMGCSVG